MPDKSLVARLDALADWFHSHTWMQNRALALEAKAKIEAQALELERLQGMGWLPMESAPKDGTKVLMTDGRGNFASASWIDCNSCDSGEPGHEPSFGWYISDWHNDPIHLRGHLYAMHWMPLPNPPEQEKV
jgi:hypothetical protein